MFKGRKISVLLIAMILVNLTVLLPFARAAENSAEIKPAFNDVEPSDSNLIYINYVTAMNIMSGFPDGSFHPSSAISRAQMAVIIARLKGLPVSNSQISGFNDVSDVHWAGAYIAAVSGGGYMEGFSDGSFHPDEELSRAQGVAALMRLVARDNETPALPQLDDMDVSHWAAAAMATALSAGMLEMTGDGRKVFPDQALTRGELACCLAVMLTRHPDLCRNVMPGLIKVGAGEVFLSRLGTETPLSGEAAVQAGDQVQTGSAGSAELLFPDGSSVLLAENSSIIITECLGSNYIKADSSPGIRVDNLNIKVQQGLVFGALAPGPQPAQAEAAPQAGLERHLAAVETLSLLMAASADNAKAPWYAQQNPKVRMKIDMPFGITAVRGTFLSIAIALDGKSRVACLIGNAELSAREAGGQPGKAVDLPGGKAGAVNGDGSTPKAEDLSEQDKEGFAKVVEWIVKTAREMDKQEEAAPGEEAPEEESVLQKVTKTLEDSGIKLDESLMDKIPGLSPSSGEETGEAAEEPEEHKDVALDKSWTLIFNEEIDPQTLPGSISVSRDSFGLFKVPITIQLDPNIKKIIMVKPQDKWGAGQTYHLIVGKGLKSVDGVSLGDRAEVVFTTASEPPGDLLEQAKEMLGLGKLSEAIKLATEAAEQAPEDYRAYLIRGQAYLGLGEEEKAQEDMAEAEDLNPWAPELEAIKSYLGWPPSLDSLLPADQQAGEKNLELTNAY